METKGKENKNLRESPAGSPQGRRKTGELFWKEAGVSSLFHTYFFSFVFLLFFPGLFPSCHSGCYGVIPELCVPGCRLFFSYSLNVIKHVSRHRRDCCTCQCQDKLSEFDKEFMVSVFFKELWMEPLCY